VDLNADKAPDLVIVNSGDNTVGILMNTVATEFSISASPLNPSTINAGQGASSTITLGLLNAFDNPVSLTCTVQPVGAASPTCALNPGSVTFDSSGKASAQLTIKAGTTAATLAAPSRPSDSRSLWFPVAALAVAGASLKGSKSNRRMVLVFFVALFLCATTVFQSSCGGGNGGPSAQNYAVTVTAISGTTQHSTQLMLTVQ
jgi:hypothetical protein